MRAFALGLLGVALAVSSATAAPSQRSKPVPGKDRAYALAFRIIREHQLLPKNYMQCFMLILESEDARKIAKFEAQESHKPYPPQCAADPDTAPRLFGMEIDMRTGKAKWDRIADDNLGMEMRPILPRHRKR